MINLNLKVHVPFNFLQSYTSNKKNIVFSQFFQSRDKRAHIKNIFLKGGNQRKISNLFFFFLKIVTKNRLLSIIICTRNERKKYLYTKKLGAGKFFPPVRARLSWNRRRFLSVLFPVLLVLVSIYHNLLKHKRKNVNWTRLLFSRPQKSPRTGDGHDYRGLAGD